MSLSLVSALSSLKLSSVWTLRHWCRTSAVQGCHDQSLIDKIIPMYFHDPELEETGPIRLSHILISDRARESGIESSLSSITPPESIGCSAHEPYIVIVFDLKMHAEAATFTTCHDAYPNGPCVRIYVPGIGEEIFPHLDRAILRILKDILHIPMERDKADYAQQVRGQVDFGMTTDEAHMGWEGDRQEPLKATKTKLTEPTEPRKAKKAKKAV